MTLFTAGHSNRTLEGFLAILEAHGVRRIVDVRSIRSEVPDDLARVVTRALAKDRNDRWQSAAEMQRALAAVSVPT